MFGFGKKHQEKKLEKLEQKAAKLKEKLEKKEAKKNGKKKEDAPQKRYDFYVDGTEPYMGHIRYDLTEYDPDYASYMEEDEKRYKYTQKIYTAVLDDIGSKITVTIGEYMVGFVPEEKVAEVREILANNPGCTIYCDISGGEYIAKIGRTTDRGTDPFVIKIILRY